MPSIPSLLVQRCVAALSLAKLGDVRCDRWVTIRVILGLFPSARTGQLLDRCCIPRLGQRVIGVAMPAVTIRTQRGPTDPERLYNGITGSFSVGHFSIFPFFKTHLHPTQHVSTVQSLLSPFPPSQDTRPRWKPWGRPAQRPKRPPKFPNVISLPR